MSQNERMLFAGIISLQGDAAVFVAQQLPTLNRFTFTLGTTLNTSGKLLQITSNYPVSARLRDWKLDFGVIQAKSVLAASNYSRQRTFPETTALCEYRKRCKFTAWIEMLLRWWFFVQMGFGDPSITQIRSLQNVEGNSLSRFKMNMAWKKHQQQPFECN